MAQKTGKLIYFPFWAVCKFLLVSGGILQFCEEKKALRKIGVLAVLWPLTRLHQKNFNYRGGFSLWKRVQDQS